jgi:predicted Zn-dependent peptidase
MILGDVLMQDVRFAMRQLVRSRSFAATAIATLAIGVGATVAAPAPGRYRAVPITSYHLANGLKVVLAPDSTTSVVAVGVYYGIGQRTEPVGHEGFAHLFEHLMFEGSAHLAPGELIRLIQANGGTFNGNTRFDFTDFWEVVPPAAVRLMLWAEADRMRALVVDDSALRRQKEIVKTEVRLSYIDVPDGGFPWLDVPRVANRNWQNAHDFRGRPSELDSATLDEVRRFHQRYYVPNNAVVVLSGAFRLADARAWIEEYFAGIPRGEARQLPDTREPLQTTERRGERIDSLATSPVLAVAFHMPPRHTRAFFAMVLIDQLVLQASDSWLNEALVRRGKLATAVFGGANLQGSVFDYQGSMLWTVGAQYSRLEQADTITAAIQAALDRLGRESLDTTALRVARQEALSTLYDLSDDRGGFGRLNLLASFALFDDDPTQIDRLESEIEGVTAADIRETARRYLSTEQRTVFVRRPAHVAP